MSYIVMSLCHTFSLSHGHTIISLSHYLTVSLSHYILYYYLFITLTIHRAGFWLVKKIHKIMPPIYP